MTEESREHFQNGNVKVGFVNKEGRNPWWAKWAGFKGADEKTLFSGPVPLEVVKETLGRVKPVKADARFNWTDSNGKRQSVLDKTRCGIVDELTGNVLGTGSEGKAIHDYVHWGVNIASNVVGDTLNCASVGLLRKGARAFVTFETPETRKTSMGIDYRPMLAFLTSLDGVWPSTYKMLHTLIVCDNTAIAGLAEKSRQVKRRHTKHSDNPDAVTIAEGLGMIEEYADSLDDELETLCSIAVPTKAFDLALNELVPIPTQDGRGKTVASNKQDAMRALWANDPRVSPWTNTAFGFVQMVNTYNQHIAGVRKDDGDKVGRRYAVTTESALSGKVESADANALKVLEKVLESTSV